MDARAPGRDRIAQPQYPELAEERIKGCMGSPDAGSWTGPHLTSAGAGLSHACRKTQILASDDDDARFSFAQPFATSARTRD